MGRPGAGIIADIPLIISGAVSSRPSGQVYYLASSVRDFLEKFDRDDVAHMTAAQRDQWLTPTYGEMERLAEVSEVDQQCDPSGSLVNHYSTRENANSGFRGSKTRGEARAFESESAQS